MKDLLRKKNNKGNLVFRAKKEFCRRARYCKKNNNEQAFRIQFRNSFLTNNLFASLIYYCFPWSASQCFLGQKEFSSPSFFQKSHSYIRLVHVFFMDLFLLIFYRFNFLLNLQVELYMWKLCILKKSSLICLAPKKYS